MIRYTAQSGKRVYRLNALAVDTDSEMQELINEGSDSTIAKNSAMGSTVTVIETGDIYMLNSSKEWVLQESAGGSSSGGDGSSSGDDDDITILDSNTDSSSTNDDDEITIL